jgi:hypothetical protein
MKTLALIVGVILSQVSAFASVETKQAKIEEILQLIGARETLEAMRIQNIELARIQMASEKGPYANNPLMKRLVARSMEKYDAFTKELMGWERWKPFYVSFYDGIFTEAQIDELITFLKTDAGQTYIRAMPGLAAEIQKRVFKDRAMIKARVDQIIKETQNEIAAEGANENPNSGLEGSSGSNGHPSGNSQGR